MRKLRRWQAEALSAYIEADKKDFLAVVTPGGGKTFWGLAVATSVEEAERLIVVCPTTEVKNQWEKEAGEEFGIRMTDLDRCETNHILTTYQQVASSPELFADLVNELPSVVIFDEIHHASDKNSWGGLILQAFASAHRRLCLTGTAFRSDNDQIPFITYEDGVCSPDFVYGYREAVRDGVCRDIIPHVFGGEVGWIREGEGVEKRSTFADVLKKIDRVARLTAALKPDGGFMEAMISAADSKLSEFSGDGGLVICKNTNHANEVAKTVERVTGSKPVLVHSNLSNPHKRIQQFREGSGRWLVSVQMVSEGVDIERLRVLVYATNVSTELFLRQAVGRVVRRAGEAHVYFPAHNPFVTVIDEIEEDRFHGIEEREAGNGGGGGGGSASRIEALFSEGWELSTMKSNLVRDVQLSKVMNENMELQRKWSREWYQNSMQVPEYRERRRERERELRRKRMQIPEYRERRRERERERGREKSRNPEYLERNRKRRQEWERNLSPEKRERMRKRDRELYRKRMKNPEKREQRARLRRILYHAKKLLNSEEAKANGWDLAKCKEIVKKRMEDEGT